MTVLIVVGVILIAAGLGGLGYCIRRGFQIKRAGLSGPEAHSRLQGLIAVNLGSVALGSFGLVLVFLGLFL